MGRVTYSGRAGGAVVKTGPGGVVPLNPRHDLANHSPDGFAWGYGGSGPAQLAIALLADAAGDEAARMHYHDFKRDVLVALPFGETWDMTQDSVLEYLERRKRASRMSWGAGEVEVEKNALTPRS